MSEQWRAEAGWQRMKATGDMKGTHMNTRNVISLATLALVCVAGGLAGGCRSDRFERPPRQFLPDMDDSPKLKPQTATEFFADGRAMRPSVRGTVAFGASSDASDPIRATYLRADSGVYAGLDAEGNFLDRIPAIINVDTAFLARGAEKYNIHCAACHNYDGYGKGMVGEQWSYPLPSFHDAKYKAGATEEVTDAATGTKRTVGAKTSKDGYIFNVVLYGVENGAKMPGYGHAIKANDAWAVVAYYRALQASQDGQITSDVPMEKRAEVSAAVERVHRAFLDQRAADAKKAAEEDAERQRQEAEARARKNVKPASPEVKP